MPAIVCLNKIDQLAVGGRHEPWLNHQRIIDLSNELREFSALVRLLIHLFISLFQICFVILQNTLLILFTDQ